MLQAAIHGTPGLREPSRCSLCINPDFWMYSSQDCGFSSWITNLVKVKIPSTEWLQNYSESYTWQWMEPGLTWTLQTTHPSPFCWMSCRMVSINCTRPNPGWTVPGHLHGDSLTSLLCICDLWSSWLGNTYLHSGWVILCVQRTPCHLSSPWALTFWAVSYQDPGFMESKLRHWAKYSK